MLHVSKPHMLYSWELPHSHKRCGSQQESLSVAAVLSGWSSTTITSYSINLGRASCQLKVEGAIILVQAKVASYWPSMFCCCIKFKALCEDIQYIQDDNHLCTNRHTHWHAESGIPTKRTDKSQHVAMALALKWTNPQRSTDNNSKNRKNPKYNVLIHIKKLSSLIKI